MQVTYVSAYSLRILLRNNNVGCRWVGYTLRHGAGLNLTSAEPRGQYVGFGGQS